MERRKSDGGKDGGGNRDEVRRKWRKQRRE